MCKDFALKFWLLAAALSRVARPGAALTVTEISHCPGFDCGALQTSVYGGGRLFFRGAGFDAVTYKNQVFVGSFECDVDDYFTSENALVCEMPYQYYEVAEEQEVAVYVMGELATIKHWDKAVGFTMDLAPVINYIYPAATWAGETIHIYGIHRASTYKEIQSLRISDFNCEFDEDDREEASLNYWNFQTSRCSVPKAVPSDLHSVTMIGRYGTGYSKVMRSGEQFRVGSDTEKYELSVHPKVEAVSPAQGYLNGQRLTLSGQGFGEDPEDLLISVAGKPCESESVSNTRVVCVLKKTASAPSQKIFEGNKGLQKQFFDMNRSFDDLYREYSDRGYDINLAHREHEEGHPDKVVSVSAILSLEQGSVGSRYVHRMFGLFTAPATGAYKFFTSGDDHTRLLISKSPVDLSKAFDESTMMEQLCDQPSPTHQRNFYANEDQSICTPKSLEQGQKYFLVYLHRQGSGGDHFTLAVQVPGSDPDKPNKVSQIQEVKINNSPVREKVEIKVCNATGGSFFIVFNNSNAALNKTTGAIAWDASDADLKTAIQRATGWWFTQVVRTQQANCSVYTVTFDGYRGDYQDPFVQKVLTPGNATVAVRNLARASPPVAGKFKLKINGETTEDISYGEWMWWLKYKLEKLPSLSGGVSVYETGNNFDGKRWLIALDSFEGNAGAFEVVDNNLTGGPANKPGISVNRFYRRASNDLFFQPVGPDFLTSFHPAPQVVLSVNGQGAACPAQNCGYSFISNEDTPSVSAFDTSADPATITLKAGFDSLPDKDLLAEAGNYSVSVGGFACANVAVSGGTISCSLPKDAGNKAKLEAGDVAPEVLLKDRGFLLVEADAVEVLPVVSAVSPSTGSTAGGTLLTISGKHFSEDESKVEVTVGDYPCELDSVAYDSISCTTSAQAIAGLDRLEVTVNGKTFTDTQGGLFQYSASATPTLTGLDKNSVSPILKQELSISGSGFGSNAADVRVLLIPQSDEDLDALECFKVAGQVSDSSVKCLIPGGKSGTYGVEVFVEGRGASKAAPPGANTLVMEITHGPPSQNKGSTEGGHLLTITGKNFSSIPKDNQVVIGENSDACLIESASPSEIKCRTQKPKEALSGNQKVYVFGRIQEQSRCTGNCVYAFDSNATPQVTKVSPTSVKAGDQVEIIGLRLKSTSGGSTHVKVGGHEVPADNFSLVSANSIRFRMPAIVESEFGIWVHVDGFGTALQSQPDGQKTLANPFSVTGISPTSGSNGGNIFVVSGNGFLSPEKTTVLLGFQPCFIQAFAFDEITCWAWLANGNGNTSEISVTNRVESVNQNNVKQTCSACKYTVEPSSATIPVISEVSNQSLGNPTSVAMTISGLGLKTGVATAKAFLFSEDQQEFPRLKAEGSAAAGGGAEEVDLQFANVSAGTYSILYLLSDRGFALRGEAAKGISISESGVAVQCLENQSFAGGSILSVSGTGFLPDEFKDRYRVEVCGNVCEVTESSFAGMKCRVPGLLTAESQAEFDLVGSHVLEPAAVFNDLEQPVDSLHDGDFETFYQGNKNCFFGYDFGENKEASSGKIRLFPALGFNEKELVGAQVQGSSGDPSQESDWQTLFTLDEDLAENWNSFEPPEDSAPWKFRYVRIKNAKYCRLAEFEVSGRIYSKVPGISLDGQGCAVTVTRGAAKVASQPDCVTYRKNSTAVVTGVEPGIISTAGGETVQILGRNLDPGSSVLIDGVACQVNQGQSSASKLTCVTGQRTELTKPSLEVMSATKGHAVTHGTKFLYADRWSQNATWGGESLPRQGDLVYVPPGKTLLVDVAEVPQLASIVVEGMLIFQDFDDAGREKTFDSGFIMVRDGVLQIGTEEVPYQSKLTITLHGSRESETFPGFGNKNIMVQGGSIDIHGKPRSHTWTLLEASADAGEASIRVQGSVDWAVGEKIIIAPTGRSREEYEEKTIASVAQSGSVTTLGLDSPLEHKHFAGVLSFDGKDTEIRGEVGLLSRNVVVQGDAESEFSQHGSHIMIRGEEGKVSGRFSYFETRLAGQAFQMGRYPIHFHMIGNVAGSYIKGCSIHHTFNRATTIHGVHYLTIQDNVYFKHLGHAIFVEDSIESNNVVENNLVVHVSASPSLLDSDLKAAGIWITHPNNFFRGNHVVGAEFFSFWFDLPPHPTGPSATTSVCPVGERLGQFDRNVAHASGIGLRIYPVFKPRTDPCGILKADELKDPFSANEPVVVTFKDNVFYMNGNGLFERDIGAVQHQNLRLFGNGVDIAIASPMWARDGQPRIENSFAVGHSDLTDFHDSSNGYGLFTGRKDGFLLKNFKFINYSNKALFKTCNGCESERHRDIGGRRTTFEGVTFENVTSAGVEFQNAEKDKDILFDKDGGVIAQITGQPSTGGWVTPWSKHLDVPECAKFEDPKVCSEPCAVCSKDVSINRVELTFQADSNKVQGQDIKVMNLDREGEAFAPDQADESKYGVHSWRNAKTSEKFEGFTINLASNYKYNLHFGEGVDWTDVTVKNSPYWKDVPESHATAIRFNNTEAREFYKVSLSETVDTPADPSNAQFSLKTSPLNPLLGEPNENNQFGDFFYSTEDKFLFFKLDGKRTGHVKAEAVYCEATCPEDVNPDTIEDKVRLWSDPAAWEGTGKVPEAGEDVAIEPTWNMVVDQDTALLKSLVVKGRLSFTNDHDAATLNSKILEVDKHGELLIGKADEVFTKSAKIVLHGTSENDSVQVGVGVAPQQKGIIVRGKLEVYGKRKKPVWTFLRQSAAKDAKTIQVEVAAGFNWKVGDKLVIGSSSTSKDNVDEAVIEAVSADGSITLAEPLKFFHYGAAAAKSLPGGGSLDMRAEVGNLSRNVVIEGSDEGGLGCSVLVPRYEVVFPNRGFVQGKMVLDSVELHRCGQRDSGKGAVNLRKLEKKEDPVVVTHSSFRDSQGNALTMVGAKHVSVTDNVIFNSRKTAVFLEGDENVSLERNLVVKVRARENYTNEEVLDVISGIFRNNTAAMEGENGTVIRGNRVSSAEWFGFVVSGHDCDLDESTAPNFADNVAHSCMAGWFPLQVAGVSCQQYSHFHAFKNSEEGFANRQNGKEFVIRDMVLADNANALVVNGGVATSETWGGSVTTKDLTIFGRALPDCADCYKDPGDCGHSGIYSSLFNEAPFRFVFESTRLPLHNSTSSAFNLHAKQVLENVRFENFPKEEGCATQARAFRLNPFYQDGVISVYSKGVVLENVAEENKFFFANHTRHADKVAFCGKRDCTGIYNIPFFDLDGSFSGGNARTLVGFNGGLEQSTECTLKPGWNLYECNPVFAQLNILNPRSDRGPVITPGTLEVIDYEADFDEKLRFRHSFDSHNKMAVLVQLGRMHQVRFNASMPSGVHYRLMGSKGLEASASATEYIILKVQSENPATLYVERNGAKVKNEVVREDGVVDFTGITSCGRNFYLPREQAIYFVVTAEESCKLRVKNSNSIALNARLDISVADFYKDDGVTNFIDRVAARLGIPTNRVRVVRVFTGSTNVDFVIDREKSVDDDAEDRAEAEEELKALGKKFEEEFQVGAEDFGAKLLSVNSHLKLDNSGEEPSEPAEPSEPSEPEEEKSNTGLIVGLAVGIPLAIMALAGAAYLVYHFKYKKKKSDEAPKKPQAGRKDAGNKETERIQTQFGTNDVQFNTNTHNQAGQNIAYVEQQYRAHNQTPEKKGFNNSHIAKATAH